MEVSGNALQWVTRIFLQIVDSNTRNSMEVQIWSANKMYNFRIQSDISPPDEVFSTCNANSNNNSNSGYGIFRLIYSAKICLLKMFFRSDSERIWRRTCLVKYMSECQFCQFRFQRFSQETYFSQQPQYCCSNLCNLCNLPPGKSIGGFNFSPYLNFSDGFFLLEKS